MLSDEEKKAIDRLNIYKEKIKDELYPIIDFEEEKAIGVVLNLIEKQQTEIEELKEGYKIQEHNYQVAMEEIEQRWKDKIIAKVIEIKDRPVKDEFITATQGRLNTIIDIENLLDEEE